MSEIKYPEEKCPKCDTIMEYVESWTTPIWNYYLYQCPKCMKIKVKR